MTGHAAAEATLRIKPQDGFMNDLGRLLIGLGLVLLVAGGLLLLLGRTGIPLGRLPGDISYRGKNLSVYFPLGTSVLVSILLSLVFYLLSRFRR
jgi:hypothetical protein